MNFSPPSEHRNLFITGATGCGKTYMACAFGMEACKQYYNTKYVRLPDLLIDLEIARSDGSYKKMMAKYTNPLVLILDEWLLLKPTESEQRDIFELLHRRRRKSTTIFCSQYEFEDWYNQLGGDASPWQIQSLTALLTTVTVSISQVLMQLMISPCERSMV